MCEGDLVTHEVLHQRCGGHFRGDGEGTARDEAGKDADSGEHCLPIVQGTAETRMRVRVSLENEGGGK